MKEKVKKKCSIYCGNNIYDIYNFISINNIPQEDICQIVALQGGEGYGLFYYEEGV